MLQARTYRGRGGPGEAGDRRPVAEPAMGYGQRIAGRPGWSHDPLHATDVALPTGGKRRWRMAAAEAGISRSQAALARETELLLAEAADAAIEVLYLQELAHLQDDLSQLAAKTAEVVGGQFQAGATPYVATIKSRLDAGEMELARLATCGRSGGGAGPIEPGRRIFACSPGADAGRAGRRAHPLVATGDACWRRPKGVGRTWPNRGPPCWRVSGGMPKPVPRPGRTSSSARGCRTSWERRATEWVHVCPSIYPYSTGIKAGLRKALRWSGLAARCSTPRKSTRSAMWRRPTWSCKPLRRNSTTTARTSSRLSWRRRVAIRGAAAETVLAPDQISELMEQLARMRVEELNLRYTAHAPPHAARDPGGLPAGRPPRGRLMESILLT